MSLLAEIAKTKAKRSTQRQLYLSMLAGISISIGCIGLAFVRSDSPLSWSVSGILSGFVFSFGLFTIFALGLELFTGNCIFLSAYMSDDISLLDLVEVLVYTLLGNIAGCIFIWGIFSLCQLSYADVLRATANAKVDLPLIQLFFRGVMCNIVISFASLMSFKGECLVTKFFAALLPVIIFVACGFEHSIADAFILLFSSLNIFKVITCFVTVLLGNIVGGAIIAAFHYLINSPYSR